LTGIARRIALMFDRSWNAMSRICIICGSLAICDAQ
jgi:hypothetical protein